MPNKEIPNSYRMNLLPGSQLGELLTTFEAPSTIQKRIARRAGALFPKNITPKQLERIIIQNMEGGIPNWTRILQKVEEATKRVYKGKPPFPKKL